MEESEKQRSATFAWQKLPPDQKALYLGKIENYFKELGCLEMQSAEGVRAKNFYLLESELSSRVTDSGSLRLLDIEELDYSSALVELLENLENIEHLRELYKLRKRTTGKSKNAGISATEAQKLRNCLRQGRELYLSGTASSLMVKPLNFFYSLSAYAYAIIILNNPIRYALENLPGSHGLNFIPDEIQSQFGGDIKQGTFSELFTSFTSLKIRDRKIDIMQNNLESLLSFHAVKITTGTGTLLSMIPEIRDYFSLVTGRPSRTYPLQIVTNADSRGVKWEFQIGDGEFRPPAADVENAFGTFQRSERYGKTIVTVPSSEAHRVKATIYSDIRGRFWYIENPFFPVILPELCTHFLLTNAFSNIMRYAPDDWGEILSNQVHSDISLITRKYLSAFENKAPALLLRSLSRFYPYVSGGKTTT